MSEILPLFLHNIDMLSPPEYAVQPDKKIIKIIPTMIKSWYDINNANYITAI